MKASLILLLIGLAFLIPSPSHAQVSVATGTYTQNFDGLATGNTSMPWMNNSTIQGWYAYKSTSSSTPITQLHTRGGPDSSFQWYGGSQDYAIGSQYSGGTGAVYFGVRLTNNTGAIVNSFSIGYTGEQWRRDINFPQKTDHLKFSYQIFDANTGSLTASSWTSVSSLDFISPNATSTSFADLDGNAVQNRVALFGLVSGLTLTEGQELWLRWAASDLTNFNDHALAIDDLTVSLNTIPEPASYAALTALVAIGLTGLRRKRRA